MIVEDEVSEVDEPWVMLGLVDDDGEIWEVVEVGVLLEMVVNSSESFVASDSPSIEVVVLLKG